MPKGDIRAKIGTVNIVQDILRRMPEHRERFWRTFTNCMKTNPGAMRAVVSLLGFYLHVGPYARYAIAQIDRQIEALEQDAFVVPQLLPPPAVEAVAVNAKLRSNAPATAACQTGRTPSAAAVDRRIPAASCERLRPRPDGSRMKPRP